jgi:hypothetical protein
MFGPQQRAYVAVGFDTMYGMVVAVAGMLLTAFQTVVTL